jgi:SAM-dependent methyltransferase
MVIIGDKSCKCSAGHQFPIINQVVDLMPNVVDDNLVEEELHWDNVAEQGGMSIAPDSYMNRRIFNRDRSIFEMVIKKQWPDYSAKKICIGEIGCGSGSAVSYLSHIVFQSVQYFGTDISIKLLKLASRRVVPPNWTIRLLRTTAKIPVFTERSLDIVFSAAALHHIGSDDDIIQWISRSLKKEGLLILYEPSIKNPVAKLGRKLIHDFHTKGEKPLNPIKVKRVAEKHNLKLVYEKGVNFLTGPLQYLFGILKAPNEASISAYYFSRFVDSFVTSPSLNYMFIQIYSPSLI